MDIKYIKKIEELWNEVLVTEKKKLDPVGKADSDIDNDGDFDSSDKYLHNRRKAIGKAMKKEETEMEEANKGTTPARYDTIKKAAQRVKFGTDSSEIKKVKKQAVRDLRSKDSQHGMAPVKVESIDDFLNSLSDEQLNEISNKLARKAAAASAAKSFEYGSSAYGPGSDKETDRLDKKADKARAHVQKRQGDKGVKKVDRMTGKLIYGRNEAVDISTKSVDKALSHDCAKHVASEQWGFGECIPGQHTLVEQEDGNAIVTHYDVMFEHGVEFDVPVEELTILVSESHKHTAKKMKESKTYADRTKGAANAETMKDKRKGKGANDMAADLNADNPELRYDDAAGHEDATKAGRVVKGQAPMRPGETRVGDKNIVNPVKGAVTRTTGKEG